MGPAAVLLDVYTRVDGPQTYREDVSGGHRSQTNSELTERTAGYFELGARQFNRDLFCNAVFRSTVGCICGAVGSSLRRPSTPSATLSAPTGHRPHGPIHHIPHHPSVCGKTSSEPLEGLFVNNLPFVRASHQVAAGCSRSRPAAAGQLCHCATDPTGGPNVSRVLAVFDPLASGERLAIPHCTVPP